MTTKDLFDDLKDKIDDGIKDGRNITIISASIMEDVEKKKIEDVFLKKHSETVRFSYEIDSSLIGGVLVMDDNDIYDGTLKNQLTKLKKLL